MEELMTQILEMIIAILISLFILLQGILMFRDLKKDYGKEKKRSENQKRKVKSERRLRVIK
jgi:Tfp pilus assembly protein PilW